MNCLKFNQFVTEDHFTKLAIGSKEVVEFPEMSFRRTYSIDHRDMIFHILTSVGNTALLSPHLK